MEPVAVWSRPGGDWAIIHRCRSCGELHSNRIAGDDNELLLVALAVRPLSRPPFPLNRLAACVGRRERGPSGRVGRRSGCDAIGAEVREGQKRGRARRTIVRRALSALRGGSPPGYFPSHFLMR
jgi:hypothetical protein